MITKVLLLSVVFILSFQNAVNCNDGAAAQTPPVGVLEYDGVDVLDNIIVQEANFLSKFDECRDAFLCTHQCPCGPVTFDIKKPPANVAWIDYRIRCLNPNLDEIKNSFVPHVRRNRGKYYRGPNNIFRRDAFFNIVIGIALPTFLDFEIVKTCQEFPPKEAHKIVFGKWKKWRIALDRDFDSSMDIVLQDGLKILRKRCSCSVFPNLARDIGQQRLSEVCDARCPKPKPQTKPATVPPPAPKPTVPTPTKPTGTKPTTQPQTKPATQPQTSKPTGTKPVTQTKPTQPKKPAQQFVDEDENDDENEIAYPID